MLHDARLAIRSLVRAPGFTLATVLTLALAAGANAAIFAVVHAVLLEPLPYRDPDRLVAVWPGQFQSNADLLFTRERGAMFSSVAAIAPGWTMALTGAGEPEKVTIARVSGNLFDTLGVEPLLGRPFTEDAARKGNDGVVVLSSRLWMTRFGGDPRVVGRTVRLDGAPVVVVAVMPRTFDVLGLESDAYTPLALDQAAWYHRLTFSFFIARLAEGRTLDQADRDYKALVQDLRRERKYPDDYGRTAALVDLRRSMVGDVRTSLLVLGGAVAFILLIAGANVGTLQLTRSASRSRDAAIRSALGASRTRLVRQVLAESALIAVAAGALGVSAARLLLPVLLAILPPDTPRAQEIAMDPLVAGAIIGAAVVLGLLAGLGPAVGSTRLPPAHLLRTGGATESRGARRVRASLVSAEVALAVMLTIGAALMLRTLWKLHAVDPGFRADGLLTLHLQPTGAGYKSVSIADYYDRLLERLRALPGVTAAGAIQHLPFSGYSWTSRVEVEGHSVPAGAALPIVEYRIVTPGYFDAMRQPLVAGRAIERADAAQPHVVVNEAFAATFFGSSGAALGRTVRTRGGLAGPPMTIVGVVGDVRHNALTREAGPELYASVTKNSIPAMMLAIRASGDPRALVPAVREAIRSIDRDVPLSNVQTMDAKIGASLGRPRLLLTLLGGFAALGMVLAVVGVYGVVAYSVAQRWKELGIMVALGAERARIVRAVLREAVLYGVAGLAIGIPAAAAAGRVMTTVVWGVSATDPVTYSAIAVATMAVVVAASLLPALRAAAVDPVRALKA